MSEVAFPPPAPTRTASASMFVITIVGVLVATVLVLVFDLFLAQIDRRESDAHAADEYAQGRASLAAGNPADATTHFGAAVAIDRSNVNYALALGAAQLQEGRTDEAEATLKALLNRVENDGAVNLAMAHVMLRENKPEDAKAFFHRAIFGRWGADSIAQRTAARFELIDLLARRGSSRELLAELLPFEETSPDSVALRLRLGNLFILAGSPVRATTMFRAVVKHDPRDAEGYAGLGQAALALGNFRVAYADFAEAARLRPEDPAIAHDFAVADSALHLDPTARGIDAHEQYLRSRALLARTIATVGSCVGYVNTAGLDSARAMIATQTRRANELAIGGTFMSTAGVLWSQRRTACDAVKRDDVLRLVHARLAQ